MSQKVRKCVIPAAGFGTRFLPATKALPKEMFPIIDKPVMQMLVEEAIQAGCSEIIIITGRSKRAIEDHFDSNFELEERLDKSGKFDYLQTVKGLNDMANIVYVRQPYPKGDGDAILRAKNLIGDEPFLVLFGDDIVDNGDKKNAGEQLIETYHRKNSSVISTVEVPDGEVSSCGIIEEKANTGEVVLVNKFLEKPSLSETKSRRGVIGKYLLTPDIFDYLEQATPGKSDGELRLADAFELMRQSRDVYALNVAGERFDTGSHLGYLKLCLHEAFKRDYLKQEILNYIKDSSKSGKK